MNVDQTEQLIQLYVDEKKAIFDNFPTEDITKATEHVWTAYLNGGTIYACGNGGNAAYVSNLICDLAMHPFVSDDKSSTMAHDVKRLRTLDLVASGAVVTGVMNDLGSEEIFAQQLINDNVERYDVVFGFSGSGNSKNILRAFEKAKQYQATTIAITRGDGGKCKELADLCIVIPGSSNFPGQVGGNDNNFHFEDALSSISHMITGIMRQRVTELYKK